MKKTFTKKERLAIYKKLLNEVDVPVGTEYYLCWKLYIELVGLDQFMSETTFNKTDLVFSKFPEFKEILNMYGTNILNNNAERKIVLMETIQLCEVKVKKKIKLSQLENWLGDDDKTEMKRILLQIANGDYLPETLREDILSSQ